MIKNLLIYILFFIIVYWYIDYEFQFINDNEKIKLINIYQNNCQKYKKIYEVDNTQYINYIKYCMQIDFEKKFNINIKEQQFLYFSKIIITIFSLFIGISSLIFFLGIVSIIGKLIIILLHYIYNSIKYAIILQLYSTQLKKSSEEICAICLENMCQYQYIYQATCNHEYHSECIYKWLQANNTCPYCRNII